MKPHLWESDGNSQVTISPLEQIAQVGTGTWECMGANVRLTPHDEVSWHSKAKDSMGPKDWVLTMDRRVAAQG